MMLQSQVLGVMLLAAMLPARADVLVDFGRTDNQTSGQPAAYNNLAIGTAAGAAINCTTAWLPTNIASNGGGYSSTSVALADTAGGASGWTINFLARTQQASTAGQVGTAGTGGDYTGSVGAETTAIFATTATRDGLYVNLGSEDTVTFQQDNKALRLVVPAKRPTPHAAVFAVTGAL